MNDMGPFCLVVLIIFVGLALSGDVKDWMYIALLPKKPKVKRKPDYTDNFRRGYWWSEMTMAEPVGNRIIYLPLECTDGELFICEGKTRVKCADVIYQSYEEYIIESILLGDKDDKRRSS